MAASAKDLEDLVYSLAENLVENTEDLNVCGSVTDEGSVLVEIRVNPDDAGRIIGRSGRVIKALRTLARAVGSKFDVSVDVELVD